MKTAEFLKLIREEVRKAVREEMKTILAEGLPSKPQPTPVKKKVELPKPRTPLQEMLYQTAAESTQEYPTAIRGTTDLLQNFRASMNSQFMPQSSVGTVSDMISASPVKPASALGGEISSADSIGEISVVPDFTQKLSAFKEKGVI